MKTHQPLHWLQKNFLLLLLPNLGCVRFFFLLLWVFSLEPVGALPRYKLQAREKPSLQPWASQATVISTFTWPCWTCLILVMWLSYGTRGRKCWLLIQVRKLLGWERGRRIHSFSFFCLCLFPSRNHFLSNLFLPSGQLYDTTVEPLLTQWFLSQGDSCAVSFSNEFLLLFSSYPLSFFPYSAHYCLPSSVFVISPVLCTSLLSSFFFFVRFVDGLFCRV